jgi:hypothetical protein
MSTSRTRFHIPLLALAALLAGCGGHARHTAPPQPKLPAPLAQQLAERSDAVAAKFDAGDTCGALADARALQRQVVAAINTGRVPARLQEPLSAAANDLTVRITCAPPTAAKDHHGKGDHKGHDKHGKGD